MMAKAPKPRSVTPSTPVGWIKLACSAVYLSYHAVAAWLTVIVGRLLFGSHPLSHPDWPIDLAVIAAGFRVCMAKGCLINFRPLLSLMSSLQFYPGLDIRKVNAGGSKAFWMNLKQGRKWQDVQVVLFYVHGGAFVGGNACMCGLTFQNWMKQLAARGVRAKVLSVEYPLAPEHAFPAALLDTAAAYTWLCKQLEGTSTCIIPVADSAGANILVAALAALRDLDTAQQQQLDKRSGYTAAAATAAAGGTAGCSCAAAEADACIADMFCSLTSRLAKIHHSSCNSSSITEPSSTSSSSSSSSDPGALSNVDRDLDDLSPAGSSTSATDLTVQISAGSQELDGAIVVAPRPATAAAAAAAGGCFSPPAAIVLVSPAMDTSDQACFHDAEWIATHEPRFDYLPSEIVGGGMSHYVTHDELLLTGYVSPMHLNSLLGLVANKWLLLAGGAELMERDITKFASRLVSELGLASVQYHREPHMPHSWAIIPTPSMWPRQQLIVDFIAQQTTEAAAIKAKLT